MLRPHAIYGVQNTCRDDTMNGGMPTGAVPPAKQSIDQKHEMANSGDRPASMQTDIAAEVEYDFDNRELCEEGTGGMLGVLDVELQHHAIGGRRQHVRLDGGQHRLMASNNSLLTHIPHV